MSNFDPSDNKYASESYAPDNPAFRRCKHCGRMIPSTSTYEVCKACARIALVSDDSNSSENYTLNETLVAKEIEKTNLNTQAELQKQAQAKQQEQTKQEALKKTHYSEVPKHKYCKRCGCRIPRSSPYEICKECIKRELFPKVKDYINENYDVNEMMVSQEFGIETSIIHEWIKEGHLDYIKRPFNPPH